MNVSWALWLSGAALGLVALFLLAWAVPAAAQPGVGQAAPSFELQDQNGQLHRLADYRGSWVVLYFYPKDDTPGCTTEACNFRDDYYRLRALEAVVLGVSLDDVASHKQFAEKYHLPFPLLADVGHDVARDYRVLRSFGPMKFTSRQTFIIDPKGQIARHYGRVDPKRHAARVISDLEALRGTN